MYPKPKHYTTTHGGNGDVLVVEDSGTVTHLEDDVCMVYGGNGADYGIAMDYAERIAALLNLARYVPTDNLVNGTLVLMTVNGEMVLGEREKVAADLSVMHERYGFDLSMNRAYFNTGECGRCGSTPGERDETCPDCTYPDGTPKF